MISIPVTAALIAVQPVEQQTPPSAPAEPVPQTAAVELAQNVGENDDGFELP
uniref:Uncharacterized protein eiDWFOrf29 n=1 Tax=Edwardsiella phage eiDWF TaxID=945084 RepID=E7EKX2_9VIRU|nr:unknown [Edwardsiella phage eiDWF]